MDDPDLRDVAVAVRDVLHEHRMRPAARDQLRAQLIAAAAAQINPPQELRAHPPEPRTDHRSASERPGAPSPTAQPPATPRPTTPRPAAERPKADRPLGAPGTGRIPVGPQAGPQLSPQLGPQTGSHRIRPAGRTAPERPARQPVPSRPSSRRRPSTHRVPAPLGWSVIGAGAALVAVLAVLRVLPVGPTDAVERVAAQVMMPGFLGPNSADPADGVKMRFSQPLDQASVSQALRITPAAMVTTSWSGDALTVQPVHGFAPNSAYVLTIDHTVAKTADGKALANDVQVVFGTAPSPQPATAMGQAAKLSRSDVAAAADGSEAVVTKSGSILVTAAVKRGQGPSGLVRVSGGSATSLASPAEAICISRSGRSIAFVNRKNGQSQIVIADSTGNPQTRYTVQADQSTPIGWINEDEVTFVSGGKLRALDRSGHIRLLEKNLSIDPAHDTLVIAPGGRYAYLAHADSAGQVYDLTTGSAHALPRTEGAPAFSADGSTVVWIERHAGTRLDLDSAPSGGGPTLSVHLPDLHDGDTISDLSVSPDGSMVTYTVHHTDRSAQLRLALLRSAVTIGESDTGPGMSPNWASDGRMFTILSPGSGGSKIQSVGVPQNILSSTAAAGAIAQAYANAQISGDTGGQLALSSSGTKPPALSSPVSRATVLYVRSTGFGTSVATIRLGVDPTTTTPQVRQATETLTLKQRNGNGLPQVTEAEVSGFAPAPAGPQLTRVDTETVPGAVLLTFDSDLNGASVPKSVALVTTTGQEVTASASYDSASRTVTLQPGTGASSGSGPLSVVLTTSLQDIAGHGLAASAEFPVQLGPTGQ